MMPAWVRFPSGQFNMIDDSLRRIAWVRRSSLGWDWIIQDMAGHQLKRGTAPTASAAKAKAVKTMAREQMTASELDRLQQERRDAGFGDDEWV